MEGVISTLIFAALALSRPLIADDAVEASGGALRPGEESGDAATGDGAAPGGHVGEGILVEDSALLGPDPMRTPAAVTVIPVDERLGAGADVAQVVDSASGTTALRFGGLGDFSAVSIRGSGLRQVQIFLDGIPLNPDGSQTVDLSELPLAAFERVEIYRGNTPPEFVAAPIGGAINLVTGASRGPQRASATYGSLSTGRLNATSDLRGEVRGASAESMLIAEAFSTQGDFVYFNDNGTLYNLMDDSRAVRGNNDKDQLTLTGRWRLGSERLRFTLMESFLSREEGLPGRYTAPAQSVQLGTRRSVLVGAVEGGGDRYCGSVRGWWTWRQEAYSDPYGEIGAGAQDLLSDYHTAGLMAHGSWLPAPWISPAATLSLRQDRYVVEDRLLEASADPRARLAGVGSASAQIWLWQERIEIAPVLQLNGLDNRLLGEVPFADTAIAPEGEDTEVVLTPRIGALVQPADWIALKANAGRYFRPPDLTELFGDRGAQVGNTDLLPERGVQWDVGVRVEGSADVADASLDLTHFWSHVFDHIIYVQNAQELSFPMNFGETWVQGLEVAGTLTLFDAIDSQSNLTWTISRNLTPIPEVANNQLPRVPTLELYQGTSVHWRERVRLGHTWSYTSGNYWDATNWFLSPPRSIHGAFVRARPGPWPLDVELSALNVTDRIAEVVPRNPLDEADDAWVVQPITDFTGYPLPGRTWLVTLTWSGENT